MSLAQLNGIPLWMLIALGGHCGERAPVQAADQRAEEEIMTSTILADMIDALNRGALKVVDLTQPLGPDTPVIWSTAPG